MTSGGSTGTSSQDGGMGKHVLLPHTTIGKLQLYLKTNTTQNHQKIELYGSPTTKDLKKPQSSRIYRERQRGKEMQCGIEMVVVKWVVPRSHVLNKNWEGNLGRE